MAKPTGVAPDILAALDTLCSAKSMGRPYALVLLDARCTTPTGWLWRPRSASGPNCPPRASSSWLRVTASATRPSSLRQLVDRRPLAQARPAGRAFGDDLSGDELGHRRCTGRQHLWRAVRPTSRATKSGLARPAHAVGCLRGRCRHSRNSERWPRSSCDWQAARRSRICAARQRLPRAPIGQQVHEVVERGLLDDVALERSHPWTIERNRHIEDSCNLRPRPSLYKQEDRRGPAFRASPT